jgi:hypothetical protein
MVDRRADAAAVRPGRGPVAMVSTCFRRVALLVVNDMEGDAARSIPAHRTRFCLTQAKIGIPTRAASWTALVPVRIGDVVEGFAKQFIFAPLWTVVAILNINGLPCLKIAASLHAVKSRPTSQRHSL